MRRAIEVPLQTANPPPGTDELMLEPGASRDRIDARFANEETVSLSVVEPTLTADEMQAGAEIESL